MTIHSTLRTVLKAKKFLHLKHFFSPFLCVSGVNEPLCFVASYVHEVGVKMEQ